ncbi:Glycoside hydrolase [Vigna unguiculata]|uniref:Glycoside hydrolase n=1 Tax=Vigna unguiculata TaxID=3917 RepID=A0A4D6NAC2_VIGUN|nr:Glycoside hydrolase [Vigna unguiculata]
MNAPSTTNHTLRLRIREPPFSPPFTGGVPTPPSSRRRGPNEIGTTSQNAETYDSNLLKRIEQKQGTPAKPFVPIDVFVFALFIDASVVY